MERYFVVNAIDDEKRKDNSTMSQDEERKLNEDILNEMEKMRTEFNMKLENLSIKLDDAVESGARSISIGIITFGITIIVFGVTLSFMLSNWITFIVSILFVCSGLWISFTGYKMNESGKKKKERK
jgi:Flp pilus assembly protein TadB